MLKTCISTSICQFWQRFQQKLEFLAKMNVENCCLHIICGSSCISSYLAGSAAVFFTFFIFLSWCRIEKVTESSHHWCQIQGMESTPCLNLACLWKPKALANFNTNMWFYAHVASLLSNTGRILLSSIEKM